MVEKLKIKWSLLLFIIVCIFTFFMNIHIARFLLDGDASELLIRASQMYVDSSIFTQNFITTTEPRQFIVTQLFVPLFYIFEEYTVIRVAGMTIAQILYVMSYLFLVKQCKIRFTAKWIGASLLLLPFSTIYARIVLYHQYYIAYAIYLFVSIGLFISIWQALTNECYLKKSCLILRTIFLGIICFIMGMNGMRFAFMFVIPLCVIILIYLCSEIKGINLRQAIRSRELPSINLKKLLCIAFYVGISYFIGYCLYKLFWIDYLSLSDAYAIEIAIDLNFEYANYMDIWNSLLIAIGFKSIGSGSIFISQVSSIFSFVIFVFVFVLAFRTGFMSSKKDVALGGVIISRFFIVTFFFLIFIYLITDSLYMQLYFIMPLLFVPLIIGLKIDDIVNVGYPIAKKIAIVVICCMVIFQGIYTNCFLYTKNENLDTYNGIVFKEMNAVEIANELIEVMDEGDYTHALVDFWYANVMIEISNGEVKAYPCESIGEKKINISRWGVSKDAFRRDTYPSELVIFIEKGDVDYFEEFYPDSTLIYENEEGAVGMNGYIITPDLLNIN